MPTPDKYSLKRLLEDTSESLSAQTMVTSLIDQVDSHQIHGNGATTLVFNHPNCHSVLDIEFDGPDKIWVSNLDVVNSQGQPDPECFRKGYGRQMLELLVQAADVHEVHLELIAAPPAYLRRQFPELPDKDELADFYARYGFETTNSNPMQVYMKRTPVTHP